jgi:acyl-CoA thioesterase I
MTFENGDRILFQGDSITDAGCRDKSNLNPLGTGYVSIIRGLLSARYPDLKVTVLNRGVSGDQTTHLLQRWDEDTIPLRPTWVSIKIGVNDVWYTRGEWNEQSLMQYKANYQQLIERTKAAGVKNLVLVSPTSIDEDLDSVLNKMLIEYDNAVRDLAKTYGAIYVPVREVLWKAIRDVPTVKWTVDGCHPTTAGHALIAGVWLDTVCGNSHS